MNKLYFNKEEIASFDDLYGKYSPNEFASPTRSTIPLLSWLKHEKNTIKEILSKLGIQNGNLHFEYSVKPKMGIGKASMTDLMVLDPNTNRSVAIEAKWTEPLTETVGKWLNNGPSLSNRKLVLQSWLDLLQANTDKKLTFDNMSNIVYQMLHRAASACIKGMSPTMVYLVFKDESSEEEEIFKQSLCNFYKTLGCPDGFPFYYLEIDMEPTNAYEPLLKLPKNTTKTILKINDIMRSSQKLFTFDSPNLERI